MPYDFLANTNYVFSRNNMDQSSYPIRHTHVGDSKRHIFEGKSMDFVRNTLETREIRNSIQKSCSKHSSHHEKVVEKSQKIKITLCACRMTFQLALTMYFRKLTWDRAHIQYVLPMSRNQNDVFSKEKHWFLAKLSQKPGKS